MKKTPDFWVGDRIVRPSVGEIQLGIERIHLEPRSMEVLVALARRAPEVAPKHELIEEVWGEAFISDEVLTHAIWDLRRAFGDHASDPEFIQTIPKKGYRLIAPVREVGNEDDANEKGGRPSLTRYVFLGIAGISILVAIAIWTGKARSAKEAVTRLANLDRQLSASLAGLPGVEVPCGTSAPLPSDFCVDPIVSKTSDGWLAWAMLKRADGTNPYTTPVANVGSRDDLKAAGKEFAAQLNAALEVFRRWDIDEPDYKPWIKLQRHDIRAIRDFLLAFSYLNRNEIGGRDPLASAMNLEPKFIAPRVMRTPAIVGEADPKAILAHRNELDSLYEGASAFEKAMIGWAKAYIDDKLHVQVRHLKVALEHQPENRPVQMSLAVAFLQSELVDEAWEALVPLLENGWCHPALYPLAGQCALALGRTDDAKAALELAMNCEVKAPDTLALLQLLAVYDGDLEKEELYGDLLAKRRKEVPEKLQVDVPATAEALARKAEAEGHKEIAEDLREFAN